MISRKRFESLTKAEQRVEIAKDVIHRIHMSKMKVTCGWYMQGPKDYNSPNCKVCALGAAFISTINIANSYELKRIPSVFSRNDFYSEREDLTKLLSRYFSKKQIDLIEEAFEMDRWIGVMDDCFGTPSEKGIAAEEFGKQFKKAEDRLLAIMQNIVDHKGTFKPEVEYVVC